MRRHQQLGFALITTLLALVLGAIIAQAQIRKGLLESRRSAGAAEATVLLTLQKAGNALYDEALPNLRAGTSFSKNGATVTMATVSGVPTYSMTVAQLRTMGYLPAGWSQTASTLNDAPYQMRITRMPVGCSGSACVLEGLLWINAPVLANFQSNTTDGPAIGEMFVKIGSDAATSVFGNASTLTGFGGGWSVANPVASQPPGIFGVRFAGASVVDSLRVGDTRDPNFGGSLTVAGPTALNSWLSVGGTSTFGGAVTVNNNLSITGTMAASSLTVGGCINMNGTTGRAGFGCANQSDIPAGYTGGVRAPDLVAQDRILVSNAPGAFTGSNGQFAILTSNNGAGAAEVRTSGRMQGDRFIPTGVYTENTACAAADEGALGRRTGGGAVICTSNLWTRLAVAAATAGGACTSGTTANTAAGVALLCINGAFVQLSNLFPVATVGAACSPEGSVGYTFNGSGVPTGNFLCRRNNANLAGNATWYRLQDVTSNMAFVQAVEVTDGTTVTKPSCPVAGGQTVFPILQIRPKTETSVDGGFARYSTDGGTFWTIFLRNGAGTALTSSSGNAVAIAETYCFYA
jgi:hypothetical protein